MKPLALAITAATMALASTASAAPASGFTTLSWGDSPKRVAALNTGYKMQYKFSDNLTYQGSPKSDLFMKLRTAAPYRYVFFKNGLYSVHMDLALFDSRQAHSQLNALLKYNTLKDEMVKQFGKPTSVVEHYTEGKPFFACIYDENCGMMGSSFTTATSNVALFIAGSENGAEGALSVHVEELRDQ